MVVVYLYGKNVFRRVTIKYVLQSFTQLDEAIRLISEETGLSFRLVIDDFGYKAYDCIDYTLDVKIIAETIKTL